MMGDDMNKFNRSRLERNGFSINGEAGMINPASRQIYLTFPADSTFREEDVSTYFRFLLLNTVLLGSMLMPFAEIHLCC